MHRNSIEHHKNKDGGLPSLTLLLDGQEVKLRLTFIAYEPLLGIVAAPLRCPGSVAHWDICEWIRHQEPGSWRG